MWQLRRSVSASDAKQRLHDDAYQDAGKLDVGAAAVEAVRRELRAMFADAGASLEVARELRAIPAARPSESRPASSCVSSGVTAQNIVSFVAGEQEVMPEGRLIDAGRLVRCDPNMVAMIDGYGLVTILGSSVISLKWLRRGKGR